MRGSLDPRGCGQAHPAHTAGSRRARHEATRVRRKAPPSAAHLPTGVGLGRKRVTSARPWPVIPKPRWVSSLKHHSSPRGPVHSPGRPAYSPAHNSPPDGHAHMPPDIRSCP